MCVYNLTLVYGLVKCFLANVVPFRDTVIGTGENVSRNDYTIIKLRFLTMYFKRTQNYKVLPRFELGSLDSESKVLTITP